MSLFSQIVIVSLLGLAVTSSNMIGAALGLYITPSKRLLSCILAFAHPTLAVDTHIFRVCNRTGLAPGKTPRAVEDGLEKVVPAVRKLHAHHWLILHGRYVCKARKPDCPACLISDICRYKAKTVAQ